MTTTLAAIDPISRRRGLLAEVHPELGQVVPSEVLERFCERMYIRNIRVGLLVTPDITIVARDRLQSMEFAVDDFAVSRVDTKSLLSAARLGAPRRDEKLGRQFLEYLSAVSAAWSSFVPSEAMSAFVPEAVGELAQADLELWEGALEDDDAR